jgi:hypothetical protein
VNGVSLFAIVDEKWDFAMTERSIKTSINNRICHVSALSHAGLMTEKRFFDSLPDFSQQLEKCVSVQT